ncbi:MAG TPA: GNAT family N-acetyltransferase [Rubrobacter sp.]|nr:GNAT family N-acetyltransferase [Rubrobacter sp.]
MTPAIRPLEAKDFDAWLPLWYGYNSFYRNEVAAEVTENTFRRLHENTDGFFGLVAEHDGGLVGLAHAIFHPSTWTMKGYCYLEDLFVARSHRGSGVARALIEGVYTEADRRGADSVYWHTQSYNAPARSLYDQVAQSTSFVVYER